MAEVVLHDVEWMLDFRPDARLQVLQLIRHPTEFVVGQRLALGALHRYMPGYVLPKIFFAFFDALVAGVAHRRDFITMQQCACLRYLRDVASRANYGVHKSGRRVHANVRLQAEVPIV